jgi:hypothetical protein
LPYRGAPVVKASQSSPGTRTLDHLGIFGIFLGRFAGRGGCARKPERDE